MNSTSALKPGEVARRAVIGSDTPPVRQEMRSGVAVLTMQHGPNNLLGHALLDALIDSLQWARDRNARAVLLRSGLREFCTGADLSLFERVNVGLAPKLDLQGLLAAFDEVTAPIVAAVHGLAVGGGLELALACDLIIAGESTKAGCIEVSIGLNPLMGGIQRITERAGSARAKEMAMLARRYHARTLERWNVINQVVRDDALEVASMRLARELADGPTLAHASTKAIVTHTLNHGVQATDEVMHLLRGQCWKSQDLISGLMSLIGDGPLPVPFEGR